MGGAQQHAVDGRDALLSVGDAPRDDVSCLERVHQGQSAEGAPLAVGIKKREPEDDLGDAPALDLLVHLGREWGLATMVRASSAGVESCAANWERVGPGEPRVA